jgi:hypothetical protein
MEACHRDLGLERMLFVCLGLETRRDFSRIARIKIVNPLLPTGR